MSASLSARAVLLIAGLAGLVAPRAAAQAEQTAPGRSAYVLVRGAVAGVEGDSKSTFDDTGAGLGLEAGVRLSPRWAVALAWWAQDLPSLAQGFRIDGRVTGQGSQAYQGQALVRAHLLATTGRSWSPFVEAGLAVVTGQGTDAARNQAGDGTVWGFGPVGGLGLDVALSPRLGLRAGVQSTVVVPDVALDGADPSAFAREPTPPSGALADNIGYDVLTNVGVGVRYALPLRRPATLPRPGPPPLAETHGDAPAPTAPEPPPSEPATSVATASGRSPAGEPEPDAEAPTPAVEPAPEVTHLTCPTELAPGEEGAFAVAATAATSTTWDWGDGSTGARARHAFDTSGTYTVTATVQTAGGEASESCLVTVATTVAPTEITACRATPSPAALGKAITVEAETYGADTVSVDLGDGAEADALPTRHEYGRTGTFTVTVVATGAGGQDTCTTTVTVEDPSCAASLAPVRFKAGGTDLTAGAMTTLDAAADLLGRCSAVCLSIDGYATRAEGGAALAQQRADAVMFYLIGQGVEADRLQTSGPGGESVEDAGSPHRVEVSAGSCAGF
ncbi:PKD domain-containing protein [Rubrivirga marina]|uniref:PKD domain-containing protein n=1 Tax=Rubrivirga marina TaxID=1196024 RepID=A0A271J4B3_9BACT|nr:PKD domain-containing protein [Rubrivirga marina]PAP78127.1 hypothetical protein BSZ37_17645 [Rubrivirga marina]